MFSEMNIDPHDVGLLLDLRLSLVPSRLNNKLQITPEKNQKPLAVTFLTHFMSHFENGCM